MAVKKKVTTEDFYIDAPYTKGEKAVFSIEIRRNDGTILFKTGKKYPIVYETTHVYRMYAETGELYYMPKDKERMTVV